MRSFVFINIRLDIQRGFKDWLSLGKSSIDLNNIIIIFCW